MKKETGPSNLAEIVDTEFLQDYAPHPCKGKGLECCAVDGKDTVSITYFCVRENYFIETVPCPNRRWDDVNTFVSLGHYAFTSFRTRSGCVTVSTKDLLFLDTNIFNGRTVVLSVADALTFALFELECAVKPPC